MRVNRKEIVTGGPAKIKNSFAVVCADTVVFICPKIFEFVTPVQCKKIAVAGIDVY